MKKFFVGFLIILGVLAILATGTRVVSIVSSPLGQFNVTPDVLYLNWTNNYTADITVIINQSYSSIAVSVINSIVGAVSNYSQPNLQTECTESLYKLYVRNAAGLYNNTIGPNTSSNMNITIVDNYNFNHQQCSPGRYWINPVNVSNSARGNETANFSIVIDIPISSSNVDNNANLITTGIGQFSGSLSANATSYHSYYFNTSEIENATTVVINLTGWSDNQDVDIFLFDNSSTPSLREKSINKTNAVEWLTYNYLPKDKMWEIRLYGNSTSAVPYNGYLIFSTLNATNTSNTTQQLTTINFNVLNVGTVNKTNITLRNEGNLNLTNVVESKELYFVKKFGNSTQIGSQNYTFLVPDSSVASRIKISLNWTGIGNYSFNLYSPNGSLITNSANNHINANVSGAMKEEYNFAGITRGYWTVEVKNNTNVTNNYNVSAFIYVNAADWIKTNYTTRSFNMSGLPSYTDDIMMNITAQNTSLDGIYEGYLQYKSSSGATLRIPINFTVPTAVLSVNNTINSSIIRIDENYGFNFTKTFGVLINNTGSMNLLFNITNSSTLNLTTNTSKFFVFNITAPSSPIAAGGSGIINVTIHVDTARSNTTGIYEGWINFNASDAHPEQTFNLTVRLNLTDQLDVRIIEIVSSSGANNLMSNSSSSENITAKFKVFYMNGTELTNLNTSNFTSVYLAERNVSNINSVYGRIPASGNLSIYNGTNPTYIAANSYYSINFSVPGNQIGGRYQLYVNTNHERIDGFRFTSTGATNSSLNSLLVVNNTGLFMQGMNATSISISNSSTTYDYIVNVSNFGPLGNTSTISSSESCAGYTVSSPSFSGTCSGSSSSSLILAGNTSNASCYVKFTINYVTSAVACTMSIVGFPPHNWFNPYGISVSVTVTTAPAGSTTPTGTSNPSSTAATTTTTAAATTTTTAAPAASEVKTIAKIAAGQNGTITIDNSDTLKIQEITIKVKNEVTNVKITVKESSLPSGTVAVMTADKGEIYKYIEIGKENIQNSDIDTVEIKFKVDNAWLNTNSIDESKLALYHYDNSTWTKLSTTLVNKSDTYAFYKAQTSSLSLFAIAGEKKIGFSFGPYLLWVVIGIVVAAAIILAYLFWPTKGEKPGSAYGARSETKLVTEDKKKESSSEKSSLSDKFSALKEKWSKKDRPGYQGS